MTSGDDVPIVEMEYDFLGIVMRMMMMMMMVMFPVSDATFQEISQKSIPVSLVKNN